MMRTASLRRNAMLNASRTCMNLVFPLIMFTYASRVLLPEGIGRTVFASSVVSYFSMLAMLGIQAYGIREAAKIRENRVALTKLVREILVINMSAVAVSYVLFFVMIFTVPRLHAYRSLLTVYSMMILCTAVGMEWLYTAMEDFAYITVRSLVFQALSVVLLFVFVREQSDSLKYAAVAVFSSAGTGLCNAVHARKLVLKKIDRPLEIKKHLRPVLTMFALALTGGVYALLDATMLGFLGNDAEVGLYSAGTRINGIVLSMVVSVGAVLLPRLSFYSGNGERERFFVLFGTLVELVVLAAFPCAVGLCVLGEPLLLLFGGKGFSGALTAMRIMNPLIVIVGLSNCIGVQLFMPLGMEKKTLCSDVCGALVNITLNVLLIPGHGAVGAAVGTLCAEATVLAVQFFFARKIISLRGILAKCAIYFLLSLLMGLAVRFVLGLCVGMVMRILVPVLSGIGIYAVLVLLVRRQFIMSLFNGRKQWLEADA